MTNEASTASSVSQLDAATKIYQAGAFPALADVSMDVAAGEVAAIMGPPGNPESARASAAVPA